MESRKLDNEHAAIEPIDVLLAFAGIGLIITVMLSLALERSRRTRLESR
jgi:hypothetical protein